MNNNKTLSYVGIVLGVIAILIASIFNTGSKGSTVSNSVFDKVLSSGTLRAGYIVAAPYIIKDPKTGQLSGISYDLTNALGKQLGLKVEWTEEAGFGTISESLSAGRYDIYAGGLWPNSDRAKGIYFTIPLYYNIIYAYARTADHRFDNNLAAINSPQVRISTLDGELGDSIAKDSFPKAQRISLPQTAMFNQIELQVVSNKADVAFVSPDVEIPFIQANPGTLRQISDTPVRTYGNAFGIKLGENNLQQMLNVSLQELINNGMVDKVLSQYNQTALRVASPYTK